MKSIYDEDSIRDRCTCEEIDYEKHSCPYDVEIDENEEENCNCCPYCTKECWLSV